MAVVGPVTGVVVRVVAGRGFAVVAVPVAATVVDGDGFIVVVGAPGRVVAVARVTFVVLASRPALSLLPSVCCEAGAAKAVATRARTSTKDS